MRRYLHDFNGCDPDDLYDVVLREIELPLFAEVMRHCDGNQSRAAACLGINRATLRKKLKAYGLA
ncbi:Fis family transcriptional regulator [Arenimonas donghaensis DSM 18148 = HO3-R19]|uniref:Putative Fis-like DNA-binding protein n=1 Tax=Arenimonas donghaensis DSM 18148 = HO3-R19 TaxID=1121014 RepID=A0A087MKA8_9GAMM|nr:Fis family transcriptional regulator [Arenimonas donghaensis DSM 18148 = HO3-R19]